MKPYLIAALFGFFCDGSRHTLFAQTVVGIAGDDIYSASGSVSFSIGEVYSDAYENVNTKILAGVQQPVDIPINGIRLSLKVLLSGPYDPSSGLMHDSLRVNQLIPQVEPYSAYPFLKPAIGFPAGEVVSSAILANSGPDAIVDWVYIELRSGQNPSTLVATKRALLQRDGDMVSSEDGISPLLFTGFVPGQYYVSVKHRNHLGVMTASALNFTMDVQPVDFTASIPVWINGQIINSPRRQIGNVYTLWGGNANFNKNTKYNGLNNDKEFILGALGGTTSANNIAYGYRPEDLNMDHKVKYNGTDNDRSVIVGNIGISAPNTIISQHTPN
jgi:hypothetical protein